MGSLLGIFKRKTGTQRFAGISDPVPWNGVACMLLQVASASTNRPEGDVWFNGQCRIPCPLLKNDVASV